MSWVLWPWRGTVHDTNTNAVDLVGHPCGDLRDRDPGERVADEHDVVEVTRLQVVDDRIDEVRDPDLGHVGRAVTTPGQVDRDHVTLDEREHAVPAVLAESAAVDQHHGHRTLPPSAAPGAYGMAS